MNCPAFFQKGLGFVLALAAFNAVHAEQPRVVPGLDLKLMPIPAGTFTMGSPDDEIGRTEFEDPLTKVTISRPFWLGQCEVTHKQWRALMGTDLAEQVRRMLADDVLYDLGGIMQTHRNYFQKQKDSDPAELLCNTDDDLPMHWVSWEEAAEFCHRLTERERIAGRLPEGYVCRLPTEAEWEYACRAGTTGATYAGEMKILGKLNAPVLDEIAWYSGNSSVGYKGRGQDTESWVQKQYPGGHAGPRTVGTKQPNAWGLHDMLGNVQEWCNDWYAPELPGGSVRDPSGPEQGWARMFRGGGWIYPAVNCRAANRRREHPGHRNLNLGFRVALAPVIDP